MSAYVDQRMANLPTVLTLLLAAAALACGRAPEPGPSPPVELGPAVTMASWLGGAGYEGIRDAAVDDEGFVYLSGGTDSQVLPMPASGESLERPSSDMFVLKLDPERGVVVWTQILGGPNTDAAYAIEVNDDFVVVGGRAGEGFPVTDGVFGSSFQGGSSRGPYGAQDGVIVKLRRDTGAVVWASYFGAVDTSRAIVRDVDFDADGDIYIASSFDGERAYPPAIEEAFARGDGVPYMGNRDGVVARIAGDGSRVEWANYVGGSELESGENSVRATDDGVAFLTLTTSEDVPVLNAQQDALRGPTDFLLASYTRDGRPIFKTYLGGSASEHVETHHLETRPGGELVIAASTLSEDFPGLSGYQRTYAGSGGVGQGMHSNYHGDSVVAVLSPLGHTIAASLLGGRFGDSIEGIAVDASGRVYVTGATWSDDFPTTATAPQKTHAGGGLDGFAAILSRDLDALLFSTYVGGPGQNTLRAAAADPEGRLFVLAGETDSPKWWPPRRPLQNAYGGSFDGIVALYEPALGAPSTP